MCAVTHTGVISQFQVSFPFSRPRSSSRQSSARCPAYAQGIANWRRGWSRYYERLRIPKGAAGDRRLPDSVVQDDTEQRAVDLERNVAVVLDEAEFFELVEEEIHARSCRADHLRQRFLRELRHH